ncbi:prephenate dehydratase [Candidatus Leptofilum sp.]|uniref:prephenate dehydratase n=1 Tax=Candidatus Leptofilum sp. TaxID=3241576 RepID=UPI003B5939C0
MTDTHPIIAFQGEPGAYSEQAVHEHFGSQTSTLPCRTFSEMFAAVHNGRATQAMLPVENSLAGMVIPAYDMLVDHDLRVQAEVIVRVEHCLMAPSGTLINEITHVMSHHQALAQCENNIKRQGLVPVDHYDTAGAARELANNPKPGLAAIASALAAETYNLEILSHNFEDMDFNFTRFFVLGKLDPPRQEPCKTSIIFTTRHVPGALHIVLGELASRGINLTKIESRPRRNRPWHYRFFVDFEGHEDDEAVQEAMLGILKQSSFLQVLGSYPLAKMPTI